MSDTVEVGGEISRTNRLFIEVRRIGEVDAKGKVKFALGFKGKRIAPPDRPLMFFACMIEERVLGSFSYSSQEAMDKDIEQFKRWANSIGVAEPQP
jgi:hypothetical protein